MPTPAMKNELNRILGMSTEVKKVTILVQSAPPGVALPLITSAEVLVAPTAIQKKGKTEMKAARSSSR
ncbi:hypothetical protein D3C86_2032820 [compost metagenome]